MRQEEKIRTVKCCQSDRKQNIEYVRQQYRIEHKNINQGEKSLEIRDQQ